MRLCPGVNRGFDKLREAETEKKKRDSASLGLSLYVGVVFTLEEVIISV